MRSGMPYSPTQRKAGSPLPHRKVTCEVFYFYFIKLFFAYKSQGILKYTQDLLAAAPVSFPFFFNDLWQQMNRVNKQKVSSGL